MKIVAVCGMGIGTSIILKMNTEKAAQRLGMDAEVEVADIGTAMGAAATADLVLTSAELAPELSGVSAPVVVVSNFTSIDEIAEKLSAHA
ncbi:MAG: PTS sugar transporter subunit IIB [Actinomycetales bacterium]|jgi:PTS system ascorbate-specific IIB component|nr:PTS sugar transporter subunit IIB [Actinomycetales bacterium]